MVWVSSYSTSIPRVEAVLTSPLSSPVDGHRRWRLSFTTIVGAAQVIAFVVILSISYRKPCDQRLGLYLILLVVRIALSFPSRSQTLYSTLSYSQRSVEHAPSIRTTDSTITSQQPLFGQQLLLVQLDKIPQNGEKSWSANASLEIEGSIIESRSCQT